MGYSIVVSRQGTVFLADTSINETPSPEQLATIAKQMVKNARMMGHEPRVAFLSFSNFGSREIERIDRIARRSACSTPRRSISNMTVRCRPTWHSTTSC